jgi:hypothetical protein
MSVSLEIEVNPPGVQAEYPRGLNVAFPGWGELAMYRWCFERPVGGPKADLLVVRRGARLVAGSAVAYRSLRLETGVPVRVAIMTGAWTLPEMRGRGCFGRMIVESVALASRRGAALLLGFARAGNASVRQLAAAGSALSPTAYCLTPPDGGRHGAGARAAIEPGSPDVVALSTALERSRASRVRFTYAPAEWASQFLDRPRPTECLTLDSNGWAVVEPIGATDFVQLLLTHDEAGRSRALAALLGRARDRGRELFVFAGDEEWRHDCLRLGFAVSSGYLTALVADEERLRDALGVPAPVPRGSDSRALADPGSPWFLGRWSVQSGDRM